MIIWLSSYPKSGNTYLRAILSTYFFSKNGEFSFELLKGIQKFPKIEHFKSLNINCNDELDIFKNYIKAQKDINKKEKQIIFLKTHSSFCNIGDYTFSDLKNTLGGIYIVRDPRNIVLSMANYFSISNEIASKKILNQNFDLVDEQNKNFKNYLGTWSFHLNSWKRLNDRLLIIKYEDLISKPDIEIIKIFKFISNITNTKMNIDHNKLSKSIASTQFENLKNLEKKSSFFENNSPKKNNFFNKGIRTNFKTDLELNLRKEIEKNFQKDLEELKYL